MAATGQTKTGGRKKGTPNKSTLNLVERMEELRAQGLDCDPIRVLMEFSIGKQLNEDGQLVPISPAVEPRDRIKAAAELCSYVFPKRKAMEITGETGTQIQFVIAQDLAPIPSEPAREKQALPTHDTIQFTV